MMKPAGTAVLATWIAAAASGATTDRQTTQRIAFPKDESAHDLLRDFGSMRTQKTAARFPLSLGNTGLRRAARTPSWS